MKALRYGLAVVVAVTQTMAAWASAAQAPMRLPPQMVRPAPTAPAPAAPAPSVNPQALRAVATAFDLAVGDIREDGGVLSVQVRNLGPGRAPEATLGLFVAGQPRQDLIIPSISPGGFTTLTVRLPGPGTRYQVMIDPDGRLAEADKANNRSMAAFVGGAARAAPGPIVRPPVQSAPTAQAQAQAQSQPPALVRPLPMRPTPTPSVPAGPTQSVQSGPAGGGLAAAMAAAQANVRGPFRVDPNALVKLRISRSQFKSIPVDDVQCTGAKRAGDAIAYAHPDGGVQIRVTCDHGQVNGHPASKIDVVFVVPDGGVPPQKSWAPSCQAGFQNYRQNPQIDAVNVHWVGNGVTCATVSPAAKTGFAAAPLPWLAPPPLSFSGYRTYRIDGSPFYDFFSVLYARQPSDVQMTLPPAFTQVKQMRLQLVVGETPPALPVDCAADTKGDYRVVKYAAHEPDVIELNSLSDAGYGKPAGARVMVATIPADLLAAGQSKLAPGKTRAWLRAYPNTFSGFCAGQASAWLPVDYGPTPSEIAAKDIAAYAKAKSDLEKTTAAKYSQAKSAALAKGGPVKVELAGWIPAIDHFPMSPDTGPDQMIAREALVIDWPKPGAPPQLKPNTYKAKTYNLEDVVGGDWPWPNSLKKNWGNGCAYTISGLIQATKDFQKAKTPDSFWEYLGAVFTVFGALYQALQSAIVQAVSYLSTGGECPFTDPFKGSPQSKSKICQGYETVLRTGLQIAMSYVGLPPNLPTTGDITEMGAEYIATVAVDYAMSSTGVGAAAGALTQTMIDQGRDYAVSTVKEQLVEASKVTRCAQPVRSEAEMKAGGYDFWDPVSSCGFKYGSPYNFGEAARTPGSGPFFAIAWLKVTPNPGSSVKTDTVTISADGRLQGDLTLYEGTQAMDSVYNSLTGGARPNLLEGRSLTLRVDTLPAGGTFVPLVMAFPVEDWKWLKNKAADCPHDAFEPQCVSDGARLAFGVATRDRPGQLRLFTRFEWTSDPALLKSCATVTLTGGPSQICVSNPSGTSTVSMPITNYPLGKAHPSYAYGIPQTPAACPGFKYAGPQDNGLPGWVTPNYDPDDLEL